MWIVVKNMKNGEPGLPYNSGLQRIILLVVLAGIIVLLTQSPPSELQTT